MPEPTAEDPSVGIVSRSANSYRELHKEHLLAMYEMYEKSAHGISDRRQIANSFYLTICTTIVGYLSTFWSSTAQSLLIAIAGVTVCMLWHRAISSYREINSAKFKIIHEFEKLLPARPYSMEWDLLDEGVNPKVYRPFAKIEVVVPWIFAVLIAATVVLNDRSWAVVSAVLKLIYSFLD